MRKFPNLFFREQTPRVSAMPRPPMQFAIWANLALEHIFQPRNWQEQPLKMANNCANCRELTTVDN